LRFGKETEALLGSWASSRCGVGEEGYFGRVEAAETVGDPRWQVLDADDLDAVVGLHAEAFTDNRDEREDCDRPTRVEVTGHGLRNVVSGGHGEVGEAGQGLTVDARLAADH
jgi:hypothetical protein